MQNQSKPNQPSFDGCKAEISNLDGEIIVVEKNIVRFEIPVKERYKL